MSINIEKIIQEDLNGRTQTSLREKSLREYYNNPNYCKYCNEIIIVKKNEGVADVRHRKFCNKDCSNTYKRLYPDINTPKHIHSNDIKSYCKNCGKQIKNNNKYCSTKCQREYEQKEFERQWLAGEISGNNDSIWTQIRDRVRNYLFRIYDNKCARCGWGEVNPYTGKIPLEVEHIDGDANNSTPENLTLLCPNCHSLTATYRGANRGNGRPKTWIPKYIDIDI